MNPVKLTPEGYDTLQKEYRELKEVKLPEAVKRLEKARSMGDLKENSEYGASKESLAFVDGRIQEIEEILRRAQVVKNQINSNEVSLGSTVCVDCNGKPDTYCIVGEFEADPLKRKLSHTSPIGTALIGKKVGDTVIVDVPAGKMKYTIVKIQQNPLKKT